MDTKKVNLRKGLEEDVFRAAGEVFEEERLLSAGLLIDRGQRMPPPVVALFRELAGEHPSVFLFTILVEMSHSVCTTSLHDERPVPARGL